MRKFYISFLFIFINSIIFAQADYSINGFAESQFGVLAENGNISQFKNRIELKFNYSISDFQLYAKIDINKYKYLFLDDQINDSGNVFNFREMYLLMPWQNLEIKIGKQWVAWGRADQVNPTDKINPSFYYEGYIPNIEDRVIPINMVNLRYYFDDSDIQFLWIPEVTMDKGPEEDTIWKTYMQKGIENFITEMLTNPEDLDLNNKPDGLLLQTGYRSPEEFFINSGLTLTDLVEMEKIPAKISNTQIGIRYSGLLFDTDYSLYYFNGYTHKPVVYKYFKVATVYNSLDSLIDVQYVKLDAIPKRFNMVGFDFEKELNGFTIRGEFAYFDKQWFDLTSPVFPDTAGLSPLEQNSLVGNYGIESMNYFDQNGLAEKPLLYYVVGIDHTFGSSFYTNLQFLHKHIFDYNDKIQNEEDRFGGTLKISDKFLDEKMETSLTVLYNYTDEDYLITGEISYSPADAITIYLKGNILDGKYDYGDFGQHKDNDQITLKVKYSF